MKRLTKEQRRKIIVTYGKDSPFAREVLGLPPLSGSEFLVRRDGTVVVRKEKRKP